MTPSVLVTKLFIPPTRLEMVPRPRLLQRLAEGLHRKLTLISAPAGFGKTTVVTEWLDNLQGNAHQKNQIEYCIAWLSLDEADNDLNRFLTYIVAALNHSKGIDPLFGKEIMPMLQSSQPLPTEAALIPLINEIATLPGKIILVLDDYHLIDTQPIHETLNFLLENHPPNLHLVITTREDPLLPLSRLRARGQLTELRAADLRFTSAEAAEFLNQVMGLNLSQEDITALERRTEGWIAGLQLAALAMQGTISLQGPANTSRLIQSFTGSHRLVLDYLVDEVLNQQPQYIQTFLLQTAVLNQLTGSLCDVLTNQDDGQEILEMLDRANLFIVPLDNERRWYRYHHLFADLLRQRLRQTHLEQMPGLHRRASEWFEQRDMQADAIRHALAGQDIERAADLAELAWPSWSDSAESLTWLGWVKALPDEVVRTRPVLGVASAQALLNSGDLEAAEARLLDVERLLASADGMSDRHADPSWNMVVVDQEQFRALPAWLATTRAYHAQAVGDLNGTEKYVEQALDLFPENDQYNRAAVTGLLGLAYWAGGDLEAARSTFLNGLFQNVHDRIKGTFVLADMQVTLGRLREAERTYEHGLELAKAYDEPMPMGTEDVYSGLADVHREQGNLEAAAQNLTASKKLGEQVELPDWQHRWCIAQARLDESLGNLDAAIDSLDEASRVFVRTPVPDVRPTTAMKARVRVKQGRTDEVLDWARERNLTVDDDLSFMREFEHITLTRALIAHYKSDRADDSIHDAQRLLERLLNAAEAGGRIRSVIEILALQALAFKAEGKISSALNPLERALVLAEPEGFVHIFVDEGSPMEALLEKIGSKDGKIKVYVHNLLAAFGNKEIPPSSFSPQSLFEPLSKREIEVLQLIAEGLTNSEIASRLFLSLNTVKVHTRNIYGKLDAHSRIQAVARARSLDILSA